MLEKYLNDPDFNRLDPVLINEFVSHQNFQLATRAYNNGWWSAARKHFMAAAKADRTVMNGQYWSCIPKTYMHQFLDRVTGRPDSRPE
jgi:hypothetical protein